MSEPTDYWPTRRLPRPVTPFPQETEKSYRAAGNRRRTGHHRRCHRPDAFRDGAVR